MFLNAVIEIYRNDLPKVVVIFYLSFMKVTKVNSATAPAIRKNYCETSTGGVPETKFPSYICMCRINNYIF